MRTKIVLYHLIALVVAAALVVACAPQQAGPPAQPAVSEATAEPAEQKAATPIEQWATEVRAQHEGTEIKVAVASHPSIEAFKELLPRFEELTGIDVVFDEMEEGAQGQKLLLEASSGTTSYDAVMNAPERVPNHADLGYLEPLDSWIEKTPDWFDYEDILPAYRDMLSYEGKHYGIPFAGETIFQFYRKDLFDKYDVEVPTTFEEVMETAAFFQDKEDGLSGISFRARSGWEFTYMWSVFIFPFGGRMIEPETGEPGLNNPETIDSLQYMIDLRPYAPVGIESFSFPEAWDAFMQGKTAMMIEASAAAPEVEDPEKSVVAGKVGYAPMPAGPDGAYSGVWGWGFSLTAGSEKKEAAWAFITYMTSKTMQDEYISNGGIVSRESMLSDPEQQEKYPYYGAILKTLKQAADLQDKGLGVVLMIPEWSQISEIMGTEGARAFAGEISAAEAAESMQAQVEEVLSEE